MLYRLDKIALLAGKGGQRKNHLRQKAEEKYLKELITL